MAFVCDDGAVSSDPETLAEAEADADAVGF
jgi:hypothetical protein